MDIPPPGHSPVEDRFTERRIEQGIGNIEAGNKESYCAQGVNPVIQPDRQPPYIDFLNYSPHDRLLLNDFNRCDLVTVHIVEMRGTGQARIERVHGSENLKRLFRIDHRCTFECRLVGS